MPKVKGNLSEDLFQMYFGESWDLQSHVASVHHIGHVQLEILICVY